MDRNRIAAAVLHQPFGGLTRCFCRDYDTRGIRRGAARVVYCSNASRSTRTCGRSKSGNLAGDGQGALVAHRGGCAAQTRAESNVLHRARPRARLQPAAWSDRVRWVPAPSQLPRLCLTQHLLSALIGVTRITTSGTITASGGFTLRCTCRTSPSSGFEEVCALPAWRPPALSGIGTFAPRAFRNCSRPRGLLSPPPQ